MIGALRSSLILLLGLAIGGACSAPDTAVPAPADPFEPLAAVIEAELSAYGAPGMTVLVLRDGETLYRAGHGVADVETGAPMSPEMLGSVASVSKLLTAVTALVLEAEGVLELDQPVARYLPDVAPELGKITVAELLSHTGGLGERTPRVAPALDGALAPIGAAMLDEAVVAPPGVTWGYSNTGFTLAGCVLEAAAGEPFLEVVRTRVFEPVGMRRSTYSPRMAMTRPHSQGHAPRSGRAEVQRPYHSIPQIAPAGELISSIDELGALAVALLQDGVVDGERVLPAGVLAALAEPRGRGGPLLYGARDYGFGVFSREYRGVRILEHEGVYGGFGASFALAPDAGLAAIAIANGRFAAPVRTTQAALELALGLDVRATEVESRETAAATRAALLGSYRGAAATLEIAESDGAFGLVTPDGILPMRLHPAGHWDLPDDPALHPLPKNWLEAVWSDEGTEVAYVRLAWRLYRRVP